MSSPESKPLSPALCAICTRRPVTPDYRPFCSRRCADVDLSRWLSNRYAVAAVEEEEGPEAASPEDD